MATTTENSKRIARNTAMLYMRMLLMMAVQLYTSRVVLNALGVTDFGIYNAVGGFVMMFVVISGSLSAAISRFITFELGKGDVEKLTHIFSTAVIIQLLIGLVVVILGESVGVWFLNVQMNIPDSRMEAANWVLQLSLLSFVINLISVPYNACIIAHERMSAFAYIGLFEAGSKLLIAFLILHAPFDRLVYYSLLTCAVAFVVRFIYGIYCKRHFAECHFQWQFDRVLFREIAGFAGWNFIGSSSGVLRDQGVNMLINVFCGPAVNAARGIAMQVSAAVNNFATNFMMALNPQITKSYAQGNRDYMFTLVCQGSRLSFYLLLFLSMPILVETHFVLELWLKIVPNHAVAFVRLVLICVMCESLSSPLVTLMLATGKIRNYQIVVGGLLLLNFPVGYVLLKWGFAPEATMIAAIVIALLCLMARLYMLRGMVGLPVRRFLWNTVLNVFTVGLLACILPLWVVTLMPESILRFLFVMIVSFVSVAVMVYFIGCNKVERKFVVDKVVLILKKIRNK